ncbi:hypothetical protein SAMN04489807_0051, partial [Microbacterium hydrocarbonoxydans]
MHRAHDAAASRSGEAGLMNTRTLVAVPALFLAGALA